MAAAEARTVWQRTVNRYFVQEDAKRAPKLTSSHSSSSTKQVEDFGSSQSAFDPHNQSSSSGFMPLHPNPIFPDLLPHNTRLWSHKPLEADVNNQTKSYHSECYGSVGYDESSEKKLNELSCDPSSPWNPLSNEKAGPWWRTTDKDELASLVAQRSLDYVENCDLPTPQKTNRSYYNSPRCLDSDVFQDYFVSSQTIHKHGPRRDKNRREVLSESDLSKSELLEAMRHCQTRAREAENMAKEAYAEKEHLVKLLLKQASELFGYKQWLKLLQLETLYLRIKNKKIEKNNNNIPWSNFKASKQPVRKKRDKPNRAKYAVSLALGMSLVCAGLLLGWTVGWMQILTF